MRVSSAVALAGAIVPIAVSARGTLGYSLGARTKAGDCKDTEYYKADFAALKAAGALPKVVRTYATVDGSGNDIGKPECKNVGAILEAAEGFDVKILVGLWAEPESVFTSNMNEALNSINGSNIDKVYAFTVGSEGLYRQEQDASKGYTADELLSRINTFKEEIESKGWDKKVGTADSWNKYDDGTADVLIDGGVDLLLVNAFAYWQGNESSKAAQTYFEDLGRAYEHIQKKAGSTTSIELWNGETGWPTTGGSNFKKAVASNSNAQSFYTEGLCAALKWDINAFYFSAFNEPWKPNTKGDKNLDAETEDGMPKEPAEYDETHWGLFDADRVQVVKDLSCSYNGDEAALREDL